MSTIQLCNTPSDVPRDLDRALRRKAKKQGKSLNELAIEAMAYGIGIGIVRPDGRRKYRDLSDLAGTYVKDPGFDEALRDQDRIDPEMWE
jgi:hypothetical protein